MLSLWFIRIYICVDTGTVMGVHGSAIGYCSAGKSVSVHVRILPNLWGHTLKGGRFVE